MNQVLNKHDRSVFFRVVTLLGLSSVCILSLVYVTIPLVPVLAHYYGIDLKSAVWAGSAFGLAYAAGNIFWGTLSERFSRVKILYTGLFILSVVTALVGVSPSIIPLILLRALEGLAAASFPAVAIAYVGDVLQPRYRALTISVISCGFLLAGVIGQIYASFVQEALNWRSVFWILSVVYLLLALYMLKLPKTASKRNGNTTLLEVYMNLFSLFRNRRLLIAWLVSVSMLLCFVGMYFELSTYIPERFHGSSSTLTWVRLSGIPSILLSILAGNLIKRVGGKKLAVSGLLLGCIGLILEAISGSLLSLILSSAIFVLGVASAVPGMIVMVGRLGSEARGSATAVYAFFVFIGASLGPIVANQLSPYGANVVFLILGLIMFIGALVVALAIRRLED